VRLVAPEFPILSDLRGAGARADRATLTARTVNLDYLLWVDSPNPYWMFLELKTDAGSFEPEQAELYAIARSRGMPDLIGDLTFVESRTAAQHEWKYRRLLSRIPSADDAGFPVVVAYLGPRAVEEDALKHVFPGEKADRIVHPQAPAKAVDHFFTLQDLARTPPEQVSLDVRPLWPYVRDLLHAIAPASHVRQLG
jgi:hypothetical protein